MGQKRIPLTIISSHVFYLSICIQTSYDVIKNVFYPIIINIMS